MTSTDEIIEKVIKKIERRIENPNFKSKVEVVRLSGRLILKEYRDAIGKRLEEQERRLKNLENDLPVQIRRKFHIIWFNEGYEQGKKDVKDRRAETIKEVEDLIDEWMKSLPYIGENFVIREMSFRNYTELKQKLQEMRK